MLGYCWHLTNSIQQKKIDLGLIFLKISFLKIFLKSLNFKEQSVFHQVKFNTLLKA